MGRHYSAAIIHFSLAILALLAGCKKEHARPAPVQPIDTADTTHVPLDTAWARPTQDLVFYEVNLRAQLPNGAFSTFVNHMDSIKALGINTLWIMPIFPIGQARSIGSPYCVKDYGSPHPDFGTLAEFKQMVQQAHRRELSVVLDWVANHTAWDHPWIAAHPDWYSQNASGQIQSPAGTGWTDVADLNYGNAAMRQEMIRSMKFWVAETGVDGFRCDAANYVPAGFWKQAIDSLKAIPTPRPLLLLAEGDSLSQLRAGFQMNYAWAYYGKVKSVFNQGHSASDLFIFNHAEYVGLPAGAQKLRFTTNHDETYSDAPPVTLFGGKQAALAASAATLFMGGVPLLYNGQEIASPVKLNIANKYTLNWSQNPDVRQAYKKLLRFYNRSAAVRGGTLTAYNHPDVLAFTRKNGTEEALILVNVRSRALTYALPAQVANTAWTDLDSLPVALGAEVGLAAYAYRVLKR
jgi:glycosidase